MPLLDHFHPPVSRQMQWCSFAAGWLTRIADQLCERVPADYSVQEFVKSPTRTGVDVAVEPDTVSDTPYRSAWQPDRPQASIPGLILDRFEVQVQRDFGGRQLVAVVSVV